MMSRVTGVIAMHSASPVIPSSVLPGTSVVPPHAGTRNVDLLGTASATSGNGDLTYLIARSPSPCAP